MTKRERPIEPLSSDEVGRLINESSRRAPSGVRNRALVATMAYCGLRLAEVLALQPKDIDLDSSTVNVRRGKGSKQRIVALPAECVAHLELWLQRRADLGVKRSAPLFPTISKNNMGQALAPRYVQQVIERLVERVNKRAEKEGKAGIEKRVHPHSLRHSYAQHLALQGVPVPHISQLLGHSSLATTTTYLDTIAPAEAIKAALKVEW